MSTTVRTTDPVLLPAGALDKMPWATRERRRRQNHQRLVAAAREHRLAYGVRYRLPWDDENLPSHGYDDDSQWEPSELARGQAVRILRALQGGSLKGGAA